MERLDKKKDQSKLIDKTAEFVDDFAKDGLRTLYLAKQFVNPKKYRDWNKLSKKAMLSTSDREEKVGKVNELLE